MLTKQQKQIIQSMSDSFAKVNEQFSTSKSFNLINADELQMLNRKKIEFEENIKIAKENWSKLAEAEASRIISLLKEDLPFAVIEKMGESNRHYENNSILIGRTKGSLIGHYERRITINIIRDEDAVIKDEYGNCSRIPIGFSYEYIGSKQKFEDIESLCSDKYFMTQIRERLL